MLASLAFCLCIVFWTSLYTVHCTLYTVHCTLYTVHCTLYTVHCARHWEIWKTVHDSKDRATVTLTQILNRQAFEALPARELINLTSLVGRFYAGSVLIV